MAPCVCSRPALGCFLDRTEVFRGSRLRYQYWLALLAAPLLVCCSGNPSSTLTPSKVMMNDSCGATPIYKGGMPDWIRHQLGSSASNDSVIYVVASPSDAAGILFGYPLRAGHPTNPNNKILWLVNGLPTGPALEISGNAADSSVANVRQEVPFIASGQGPSIVDLPAAGCWHLQLSWSGHTAAVDVPYH